MESVDGWILRFPRDDGVAFEREIAILERVCGHMPARTPRVEWTGRNTRFAAYRTLTGTDFDAAAYSAAPARQRDVLARSLARLSSSWKGWPKSRGGAPRGRAPGGGLHGDLDGRPGSRPGRRSP